MCAIREGTKVTLHPLLRQKDHFVACDNVHALISRLTGNPVSIRDETGEFLLPLDDGFGKALHFDGFDQSARDGGMVDDKVTLVEYLGSEVFVHVGLPFGANMMVKAPGHSVRKVGDALSLGIGAAEAHYFGPDGLRLPYSDADESGGNPPYNSSGAAAPDSEKG